MSFNKNDTEAFCCWIKETLTVDSACFVIHSPLCRTCSKIIKINYNTTRGIENLERSSPQPPQIHNILDVSNAQKHIYMYRTIFVNFLEFPANLNIELCDKLVILTAASRGEPCYMRSKLSRCRMITRAFHSSMFGKRLGAWDRPRYYDMDSFFFLIKSC
jgi:hypothetical protein